MATIKFSHAYSKLLMPDGAYVQWARLLDVLDIDLGGMSKAFLDYDTDEGTFTLPKSGEFLMLVFQKYDTVTWKGTNLFTTLRRSTPQKRAYYRSEIGRVFDVKVSP